MSVIIQTRGEVGGGVAAHLQCPLCGHFSKSHAHQLSHMAASHPTCLDGVAVGRLGNILMYQSTARLFHCGDCFFTSRDFTKLYKHIISRHCLDEREGGAGDDGEEKTGEERTGEEKTGEERTGEEKTGEDGEEKTGQERTGEEKTGEERTGEDGEEKTGEEKTGEERTGEDGEEKTGEEKTGEERTGEEKSGEEKTGEDGEEKMGEEKTGEDGEDKTGEDSKEKTGEEGTGEEKTVEQGTGQDGEKKGEKEAAKRKRSSEGEEEEEGEGHDEDGASQRPTSVKVEGDESVLMFDGAGYRCLICGWKSKLKGMGINHVVRKHDIPKTYAAQAIRRDAAAAAANQTQGSGAAEEEEVVAGLSGDLLKEEMEATAKVVRFISNRFVCLICGWKTKLKGFAISHVVRSHDVERPYRCKDCNRSFFLPSRLQQHVSAAHRPGRYACPFCCFRSHFLGGFRRHCSRCNAREEEEGEGGGGGGGGGGAGGAGGGGEGEEENNEEEEEGEERRTRRKRRRTGPVIKEEEEEEEEEEDE